MKKKRLQESQDRVMRRENYNKKRMEKELKESVSNSSQYQE